MALSVIASPGHATRVVRSKPFSRSYPVQKLLIVKVDVRMLTSIELQTT